MRRFAKLAVTLTENKPDKNFNDPGIVGSAWDKHVEITNKHYEPGKFTTLIAFEWTSIPVNQNLLADLFVVAYVARQPCDGVVVLHLQ